MINPVIISNASDLKTTEMFQLMKETMKLDQTILLTTTIRIEILQKSPGILIRSDKYTTDSFFWKKNNTKISKPWIITGRKLNEYSRRCIYWMITMCFGSSINLSLLKKVMS